MADYQQSAPRLPKPWLLTIFALLAIGGLVSMPILAGPPEGDKMPDIVRFLGHFHPLVLHLPIGVFALIIFQEVGAIFGRRHHEQLANRALFPLFFGAASAVIAVIAGFLLYQGGDEYAGNALAERHMWAGLAFSVGAILTLVFKAWTISLAGNPAFYRLLLFTSVGIMGFASHDGGSITHGENYLTEFAPAPVRKVLGLEIKAKKMKPEPGATGVPAGSEPVFASIVSPILERRCMQCHKESKSKGKFRMDSYELLVKGGKEGAGLEPGNAAKSRILTRIHLPEDDDEHMPPEGKPAIEPHEIAILEWWINQGADPTKTLADYEVPAPIQEAISKLAPAKTALDHAATGPALAGPETAAGPEKAGAPVVSGPPEALKASVADISKVFPGALSFESQNSSLLNFTAVSLRGTLDDAGFQKITPVLKHLVTVDLSATKITDASVALLATSKDLRLVRLAETAVTDAAIDTLVKLPSLESINLYGTKVTDAGIAKLAELPELKHLYLWQTPVTPEAIKALQQKLPSCEVVMGIAP
jgi:uncharacterized membrane protein